MGAGERIAYLSDLNYISYYVGRDIDAPRFKKNSKEEWYEEPLHKLNVFERRFYKKTYDFVGLPRPWDLFKFNTLVKFRSK